MNAYVVVVSGAVVRDGQDDESKRSGVAANIKVTHDKQTLQGQGEVRSTLAQSPNEA